MLRAVSIEFHHRVHHEMWTGFWDTVFFAASAVLIIFFGAALGNVVRGVPLDGAGFFSEPLWNTFSPLSANPGILDWFTVTIGLLALSTLCQHGAAFLALRTDGPVHARARRLARGAWIATIVLAALATLEMAVVRPAFLAFIGSHAFEVIFPMLAIAGIAAAGYALARGRDGLALIGSGAFIAGMLTSTVFSLYPTVLPAVHAGYSLTIDNASSSAYGLSAALHWWPPAMILAICYFVAIYWLFRGKVPLESADGGAYSEPVAAMLPPASPSIAESEHLPVGSR
jgi:cytochrome d ubiquinol oxidase subunit II